ncbi:unnamed protein product [Orchesella dallaii]|uniref:Uncharacterized protein n=1 Tax=Orchesella dallaii TaxID=48710 RepID=A0ABP1RUF0_9HEXA
MGIMSNVTSFERVLKDGKLFFKSVLVQINRISQHIFASYTILDVFSQNRWYVPYNYELSVQNLKRIRFTELEISQLLQKRTSFNLNLEWIKKTPVESLKYLKRLIYQRKKYSTSDLNMNVQFDNNLNRFKRRKIRDLRKMWGCHTYFSRIDQHFSNES